MKHVVALDKNIHTTYPIHSSDDIFRSSRNFQKCVTKMKFDMNASLFDFIWVVKQREKRNHKEKQKQDISQKPSK